MIGAGGIFRAVHLPSLKTLPEAEIVALADVNLEPTRKLAETVGTTHVFKDYRDLLKLDLDAVLICTPNKVHFPAVMASLHAGKHVFCEKPLATTVREVRQMGELADRKKLKLMTGQHQRFTTAATAIKAWADAGSLGTVYHARVHALRRAWLPCSAGFIDRSLSGGGPCMDIGVHALDLCLWLMGFPQPVSVTGTTKVNFAKTNKIPGMWGEWDRKLFSVEDFAAGFVHFDSGATLVLESSWLGHQAENENMSCQLYGIEGSVHWPSMEFVTVKNRILVQGTLTHPKPEKNPHAAEIRAFLDCVIHNQPSPVPWRETIKTIAILEGVYQSSNQGGRQIKLSF